MNAKKNRTAWLITSMVATCIAVACASAKDIYVNCNPKPRYVREDGTMKYPFRTIQQGIKAAVDGDRVKVYPGIYKSWPGSAGIDFGEKEIALVSTIPDDPAATVIEGQGIRVAGKQTSKSQIRGFTIRGAGIYLENSSPAVVQCIFEFCPGRAITCVSSNARIQNCIFVGNTVPGTDSAGGAICCSGGDTKILDCTFMGNGAGKGGAIAIGSGSPIIRNCILWGNASLGVGDSQVFVAAEATPSILHCNVQDGASQGWFGTGNIDLDPLLTAAGLLRKGSPCIGKGTKVLPAGATATDIQGETRPAKGKDPNKVDMGADEWSDADADGLPDFWEQKYFGGQTAADPAADSDGDGLSNLKEYEASTNPKVADTDNDYWNDGREVACGANPRGKNLYVDRAKGSDLYDGNSPDHVEETLIGPKQTIERAIEKAKSGQTVILAPGTYTDANNCDLDFSAALAWGERVITIQSQNPFDPNVVAATVIDPKQEGRAFYFHDVHSPLSCVQGLTLRNGFVNSSTKDGPCGGAILFSASSPTISHCTIAGNVAMQDGGGLCGAADPYVVAAAPTIVDCDISGNEARGSVIEEHGKGGGVAGCAGPILRCSFTRNFAGWGGGAIYNEFARSSPLIVDCTISDNTAGQGGGIYNRSINAQSLVNCRFVNNRTWGHGGAVFNYSSSPNLYNCIFSGNSSGYWGGGMFNENGANPTLWNCTFAGNVASVSGGGIIGCNPILTNCIFFENRDGNGESVSSQINAGRIINYCCVQNWSSSMGGVGNIGDDPCFANPGHWDPNGTDDPKDDFWVDGDYHLRSQAGRWDPNVPGWVKDGVTSPCIDAGDRNSPVGDEPEPNGARINMGAYGGTAEASKSYP